MLAKEAELFEKANIVDIGLQPGEFTLEDSVSDLSLSNGDDPGEAMETMNIDEVDDGDGLVDNNLIVDEAYRNSLSERASQFASQHDGNSINTNPFLEMPKPEVIYVPSDKVDIRRELDEWFSSIEVNQLCQFRQMFDAAFEHRDFNSMGIAEKESTIEQIVYDLRTEKYSSALQSLLYIAMGAYEVDKCVFEEQIDSIRRNTLFLVRSGVVTQLVTSLKSTFKLSASVLTGIDTASKALFHCATILYIVLLVFLDNDDEDDEVTELRTLFDKEQLLVFLIKSIDDWRWNSRTSMRIRNIITLLAKLIQFQIGGFEKRQRAKAFLCKELDITKEEAGSYLTASPIDFHLFREDILSRYPSYVPPPSKLPEDFENPSSLSQFIMIPRRQKHSRQNGEAGTPPPEIHIATPVPSPSPPMSPINRSSKTKRIFRTSDDYPFIYPTEHHYDTVPKSIKEATELFASRVREKLSLKQLWSERDNFVRQERGWSDSGDIDDDDYDYEKWDEKDHREELKSLKRVENLYRDSLSHLSSLVHVLAQLVVSSQNSSNSVLSGLATQVEHDILRAKEVLVKNATYMLHLLLKWFKTNHIIKFEYLSTLIYDSNFFSIVIQYLNAIDTNLLNRINLLDVYESKNSLWLDNPEPQGVDNNFCFTLVNLLEICSMVCQKKTQRFLSVSELNPAPAFKNILSLTNPSFWSPVLKIVKQITSFNGKKWKANNMDLISMVYIHGKLDLKDNWLSGRDIDAEIADAYGQEIALRALIQFYNSTRYITTMKELGYEKKAGDFFTREIELISNDF